MVSEVHDIANVDDGEVKVHVEVIDQLVQICDVLGVNSKSERIGNTLLFVWHMSLCEQRFID